MLIWLVSLGYGLSLLCLYIAMFRMIAVLKAILALLGKPPETLPNDHGTKLAGDTDVTK